jgi:hypothetical protein
MPKDTFVRQKFTKELSAARNWAREYFAKSPKERSLTEVESWWSRKLGVHDEAAAKAEGASDAELSIAPRRRDRARQWRDLAEASPHPLRDQLNGST